MKCNFDIVKDNSLCISDIHNIVVEYNGNSYNVIFGKYINGGFCCIPNWNIGCELSDFKDVFWNAEALCRALESKKAAKAIAQAMAQY